MVERVTCFFLTNNITYKTKTKAINIAIRTVGERLKVTVPISSRGNSIRFFPELDTGRALKSLEPWGDSWKAGPFARGYVTRIMLFEVNSVLKSSLKSLLSAFTHKQSNFVREN